jgi:DNA-binding protein YbaB
MNIQKMLQQAQRMQAKLAEKQAELSQKTIEASAGGGKVPATSSPLRSTPALSIRRMLKCWKTSCSPA